MKYATAQLVLLIISKCAKVTRLLKLKKNAQYFHWKEARILPLEGSKNRGNVDFGAQLVGRRDRKCAAKHFMKEVFGIFSVEAG